MDQANVTRREIYAQKQLHSLATSSGRDDLLAESLKSKEGLRLMPLTAAALGSSAHYLQLVENTKKLFAATGGRHKKQVAHLLIDGLPKSFAKKTFNMSNNQYKRTKETLALRPGAGIEDAKYSEDATRDKVSPIRAAGFKMFYESSTYMCSGADNSKSRILDCPQFEWQGDMEGQWPGILREVASRYPHLVPDIDDIPKTGWTREQANMLCAAHSTPTDPAAEARERAKEFHRQYVDTNARKNGHMRKLTKEEEDMAMAARAAVAKTLLTKEAFDPLTHIITTPNFPKFKAWLKREGLRYTMYSVPHPCPLCTNGPTDEAVLTTHLRTRASLEEKGQPVPAELQKDISRCASSRETTASTWTSWKCAGQTSSARRRPCSPAPA
jgi:hypothetical protein